MYFNSVNQRRFWAVFCISRFASSSDWSISLSIFRSRQSEFFTVPSCNRPILAPDTEPPPSHRQDGCSLHLRFHRQGHRCQGADPRQGVQGLCRRQGVRVRQQVQGEFPRLTSIAVDINKWRAFGLRPHPPRRERRKHSGDVAPDASDAGSLESGLAIKGREGMTTPIRDPGAVVGKTNPASETSFPDSSRLSDPSSLQAVSLLVAGIVALNAAPALALNSIELTDQRVTNKEGLQLIYEVRAPP